jgi:hypothetical protein
MAPVWQFRAAAWRLGLGDGDGDPQAQAAVSVTVYRLRPGGGRAGDPHPINSTPAEKYSQFLQKMETPNRGAPGPAWPGLRVRMFSRMEVRRAAISAGI